MRDIVVQTTDQGKTNGPKELLPDGIRRKPPISVQQALSGVLPPPPLATDEPSPERKGSTRPSSIASSEGVVPIEDDIDDDITTTGSESYGQDDSSTNEGNGAG